MPDDELLPDSRRVQDSTETVESSTSPAAELTIDDRFRRAGADYEEQMAALKDTFEGLSEAAVALDEMRNSLDTPPGLMEALGHAKARGILQIVLRTLKANEPSALIWQRVSDEWNLDIAAIQFITLFLGRLTRPRREPMFNAAILTSAVAAFEVHLSVIAEIYFRITPEALHAIPRDEVQEFSLRDLQAMSSLEDAIELAVERRVDRIANSGLSGWRKFFQDRLKIDLFQLEYGGELREIFERRHCVVHNGGRASRRYVNTTGYSTVGELLTIDNQYVKSAVERLSAMGSQLVALTWMKFAETKQPVDYFLERRTLTALTAHNFEHAHLFARLAAGWADNEESILVARVNLWLAQKGLHGNRIPEDAADWNVSTRSNRFKLAKYCLVDDFDQVYALLPTMVTGDEISRFELATWPLLERVREDPRFQPFFASLPAEHAPPPGAPEGEEGEIPG